MYYICNKNFLGNKLIYLYIFGQFLSLNNKKFDFIINKKEFILPF